MSFHLDLEFAKDCAVWREMLQHESLVEKQSVGALAGTYGRLPPSVLSHFLTHGHTHERLLPPREQKLLAEAQANAQFSFDRNPSYALYDRTSNLDRGGLYALTHSAFAQKRSGRSNLARVGAADEGSLQGQHPHAYLAEHYPHAYPQRLPTHQALGYLHGADAAGSARRNGTAGGGHHLYPRAATTYAQGPYYSSRLAAAALAASNGEPHPSLRQHPETSTYRRATTGRRHDPFPRCAPRGGQGAAPVEASSVPLAATNTSSLATAASAAAQAQPQPLQSQPAPKATEESKSNDVASWAAAPHAVHPGPTAFFAPRPPQSAAFHSTSSSARPAGSSSAGNWGAPQRAPAAPHQQQQLPQHALTARPATSASAAPASARTLQFAEQYTGRRGSANSWQQPQGQQQQQYHPRPPSSAQSSLRPSPPSSSAAAPAAVASSTPAPSPAAASPPSAVVAASSPSPSRQSQLSAVTQLSVSHPSRAGFAPIHAASAAASGPSGVFAGGLSASSRAHGAIPATESLLHTLPTAQAARASHAHDHRAAFGSRGVFRVEPITKLDQGLHASHPSW